MNEVSWSGSCRAGDGAGHCCCANGFDRGIGLCVSGDGDVLAKLKLSLNSDNLGRAGVSWRDDAVLGRSW
jgi:hypothetical protein